MVRASKFTWVFLLIAPVAVAQPAGGPAPVPAAPPVPAAAPVAAPMPLKPTITGGQMLGQGLEYRKQIASIIVQIQTQAEQAKKDKDVIRLNCLLDKLTQAKVNANMMDKSLETLQEGVTRRDESAELHEYTRITIINQKVQVLAAEADACVGAEANYVGPTRVVVEVPPGLTDTVDQPPPPAPPVTFVERPPVASPFQ